MGDTRSSIHVSMFPWFAYGHLTPFLHLANKLAERGHRISFLLPKGAQPKLNQLNKHPQLIHFYPVVVPHVDGLPLGAETCSEVPYSLHTHLCTAFDQTKPQVKTILGKIKPDFVFYDFAHWVPCVGKELGIKSIMYSVICATGLSQAVVPSKKMIKGMSIEDMMQLPPGYPSSTVLIRSDEIPSMSVLWQEFGSGITFYERLITSIQESDAFAIRSCYEIEGPFINYLGQQFSKPVLVTGPVLSPEISTKLEDKWDSWLNKYEPGSVVYCAFGSQITLQKDQFQELVLGFESCGFPFLVVLTPPSGCSTVEEALPNGFEERVKGRGCVYGGWVQQQQILDHESVGCFVSHCGFGSMWESLLSDCQIVLIPHLADQIVNTILLVEEFKVAVEVKKEENGWVSKQRLSDAIISVMDKGSEVGIEVRNNHTKLKNILSAQDLQETYVNNFINNLQALSLQ